MYLYGYIIGCYARLCGTKTVYRPTDIYILLRYTMVFDGAITSVGQIRRVPRRYGVGTPGTRPRITEHEINMFWYVIFCDTRRSILIFSSIKLMFSSLRLRSYILCDNGRLINKIKVQWERVKLRTTIGRTRPPRVLGGLIWPGETRRSVPR